jgi:hypothetical protein
VDTATRHLRTGADAGPHGAGLRLGNLMGHRLLSVTAPRRTRADLQLERRRESAAGEVKRAYASDWGGGCCWATRWCFDEHGARHFHDLSIRPEKLDAPRYVALRRAEADLDPHQGGDCPGAPCRRLW